MPLGKSDCHPEQPFPRKHKVRDLRGNQQQCFRLQQPADHQSLRGHLHFRVGRHPLLSQYHRYHEHEYGDLAGRGSARKIHPEEQSGVQQHRVWQHQCQRPCHPTRQRRRHRRELQRLQLLLPPRWGSQTEQRRANLFQPRDLARGHRIRPAQHQRGSAVQPDHRGRLLHLHHESGRRCGHEPIRSGDRHPRAAPAPGRGVGHGRVRDLLAGCGAPVGTAKHRRGSHRLEPRSRELEPCERQRGRGKLRCLSGRNAPCQHHGNRVCR